LAPERFAVLTGRTFDDRFDALQQFRLERTGSPVLLPTPALAGRVRTLASEIGAELVVLDPALPLGMLGPLGLGRHGGIKRYAVIVHGAEIALPGQLPGTRQLLKQVLAGASLVVTGGMWVADHARRVGGPALPIVVIPPGVDVARFQPLSAPQRRRARTDLGLPSEGQLVLGVSRLVPRKGMDTLIKAAARLAPEYPDMTVVIAGEGRERTRIERLAAGSGVPVRLLGRVPDECLPALYACADIFATPCRRRWSGLEQEGFGIVFLEAAASGVPQVAGRSGGSAEAVVDGETGIVVEASDDPVAVASALRQLLDDPDLAARMGAASRRRAETDFSYDRLATILDGALAGVE